MGAEAQARCFLYLKRLKSFVVQVEALKSMTRVCTTDANKQQQKQQKQQKQQQQKQQKQQKQQQQKQQKQQQYRGRLALRDLQPQRHELR
jgi:sortase (surface protein transpeptidase)